MAGSHCTFVSSARALIYGSLRQKGVIAYLDPLAPTPFTRLHRLLPGGASNRALSNMIGHHLQIAGAAACTLSM